MTRSTKDRQPGVGGRVSPFAGKPADPSLLINVAELAAAYYSQRPDASVPEHRVSFGTSGHRGSSLTCTFNEWHVAAIAQAVCRYRRLQSIDGPLFLGFDTHPLSEPAFRTTLEVLAANDIDTYVATHDEYTPTPAISHGVLTYNAGRERALADGIVLTPSHNPPGDGGFKYNPPHGGPASADVTRFIEQQANDLLSAELKDVRRIPYARAAKALTTHYYDFLNSYVADLGNVIDLEVIRSAKPKLGVDPLGGAGVHYWPAIADRYGLDLTIVNRRVDPAFGFMDVDWDGRIRMDPSSPYAMHSLVALKDQFDVAFACDTDHDRHGIVTRSRGLLPSNHFLAVCVRYLFTNRPGWSPATAVGKTIVSSTVIDRVCARLGRKVCEVPVGFKWFVQGLLNGWLGFGGEESAGASFLRRDGAVWTTDKDGIIAALLAAEITAQVGRDPGQLYDDVVNECGASYYERIDAPATQAQKAMLASLSPESIHDGDLAGEPIRKVMTTAPGNGHPIGGVKVISDAGWFAARPSGTEEIYKIYAESFRGQAHLLQIQDDAQRIVEALADGVPRQP